MPSFKFVLLSVLLISNLSFAADLFRVYDVRFEGKLLYYHVEDLDNDGLKDLLVFTSPEETGAESQRWVSVYLQEPDSFPAAPAQRFRLPEAGILFDIGDVVGDSNKELVYFTDEGLAYLTFENGAFKTTPRKLFAGESIFMLADPETVGIWDFVADMNGDGRDEILVPQFRSCELFLRRPNDAGWTAHAIPLRMMPEVFAYYNPRFSVGRHAGARYALPYMLFDDYNADGRRDLLAVYPDSLVVFCQDERGAFAATCRHRVPLDFGRIWPGVRILRTHIGQESLRRFLMRIIDLNGDTLLDAVALRVSTKESIVNPETEVQIYFGRTDTTNHHGTARFPDEPDQTLEPDGTLAVLDIQDLNRDGKVDLMIPTVQVGLRSIIGMLLNRRVNIDARVFLLGEDDRYPDDPTIKRTLVIPFTFEGGPTSPVYEIDDFNGDGYYDLLSSLEETRLVVFWGKQKDLFDASISARFNVILPQDGELVMSHHLNRDRKCDLIVTYSENEAVEKGLEGVVRILLAN